MHFDLYLKCKFKNQPARENLPEQLSILSIWSTPRLRRVPQLTNSYNFRIQLLSCRCAKYFQNGSGHEVAASYSGLFMKKVKLNISTCLASFPTPTANYLSLNWNNLTLHTVRPAYGRGHRRYKTARAHALIGL